VYSPWHSLPLFSTPSSLPTTIGIGGVGVVVVDVVVVVVMVASCQQASVGKAHTVGHSSHVWAPRRYSTTTPPTKPRPSPQPAVADSEASKLQRTQARRHHPGVKPNSRGHLFSEPTQYFPSILVLVLFMFLYIPVPISVLFYLSVSLFLAEA
jgi:hypothetical protein